MYNVYSIYFVPENRVIYIGLTSRDPYAAIYEITRNNNVLRQLVDEHGYDSLQVNILVNNIEDEDKAYNVKEYYTNYYNRDGNKLINIAIGRHNMIGKPKEVMQEHYKNTLAKWQKEHGSWIKGKHLSEETKKILSEQRKGKPLPEETLRKLRENPPTARPVYCLNNDKIYKSAAEAGRDLGLDPSSILKTVKHQYTNTKGYIFSRPIYLTVDPDWK